MSTYTINGVTLALLRGSITEVQVDAVVNAANAALAGGGGVDGAIHRAGGPAIMQACRQIGGCPTGSAVATGAGNLKARYIFHAVGPIYRQGGDAAALLVKAYQSCLNLAEEYHVQSIAFPSLSTGAYGYPVKQAAPLALNTLIEHIKKPTCLQQAMFVLLDGKTFDAYQQALIKLLA